MFVTIKNQQSLTNRATQLRKRNGVADLQHASHAEFGRSALKCVDINIGEHPKWRALELRGLGMGKRD